MKKIYLLVLPILTLILAGCFHVKPFAGAVKYNCEYSGGKFENGKCACPKGENDKDVWTYEESSGYCLTPFGTPGGERGEELKKMSEQKFQESDATQNTYERNGYRLKFPENWKIVETKNEGVIFVDNKTNKTMAHWRCPILETGYEVWDFKTEKRQYQKNGLTYQVRLDFGTPTTPETQPITLIFMEPKTLPSDKAWLQSCQIDSTAGAENNDIFRAIYNSIE